MHTPDIVEGGSPRNIGRVHASPDGAIGARARCHAKAGSAPQTSGACSVPYQCQESRCRRVIPPTSHPVTSGRCVHAHDARLKSNAMRVHASSRQRQECRYLP